MPLPDILLARLIVPLGVAVLLALALRLIAGGPASGRDDPTRIAALAVPAGLVAGYAMSPGFPWVPPVAAIDKLAWLAVGGGLLGLAIDLGMRGRSAAAVTALAALAWPALGLAWLGPELLSDSGPGLYRFGEVSLVLGLVLARLVQLAAGDGTRGPVVAAVLAAGLGCLGLVSGVPEQAAVGLPLATALLGWIVCNWPGRRLGFGAAGLLGGAGVAMPLAGHAALLTPVNATLVLLVLTAVLMPPLVPAVARRMPVLARPALRPPLIALVAAVPAALAVLLAWLVPDLIPSLYD